MGGRKGGSREREEVEEKVKSETKTQRWKTEKRKKVERSTEARRAGGTE